MKKALVISALILSTSFAFSQTTKDTKAPADKTMQKGSGDWQEKQQQFKDRMAKELNLSADQVKQINAIDDKYKPQEDAIREQRKQLMEQKKAEVEKVLTPDQKQKLQEMKDKFRDKRMEMHKSGQNKNK